jgi:hypothetical protein
MLDQRLANDRRRRVLRLADRQPDGRQRRRGDAGKQGADAFKGIGLEPIEARVHQP